MVADPRDGDGRGAALVPRVLHQPGPRPVRRDVEPGLVGFRPELPVSGEAGVDQPRVQWGEVLVVHLESLPHARGEIGDEDIGPPDESDEDLRGLWLLQIDREATL